MSYLRWWLGKSLPVSNALWNLKEEFTLWSSMIESLFLLLTCPFNGNSHNDFIEVPKFCYCIIVERMFSIPTGIRDSCVLIEEFVVVLSSWFFCLSCLARPSSQWPAQAALTEISWTENNNKFFYQQLTVSYYLWHTYFSLTILVTHKQIMYLNT